MCIGTNFRQATEHSLDVAGSVGGFTPSDPDCLVFASLKKLRTDSSIPKLSMGDYRYFLCLETMDGG